MNERRQPGLLSPQSILALLAGDGLHILCRDALDLRAVSRFTIARIARHHTVLVKEVQIPLLALSPTPRGHYTSFLSLSPS